MPTFGGLVVATGGAPGDDRRTLLDIIDEMSRPFDASDTTVRALAGDAFRAAVRTMNRKGLWPWEFQEETLTQTVSSPYTTVNSSVKKPLAMYYLDGANGQPQTRVGYERMEVLLEEYDLSLTGRPFCYSTLNLFETGQIRWVGIPDSAESLRFSYYRFTPAPRTEAEAVEIPDSAIEAYMAFAWYELAKRLPAAQARMPLTIAKADALQAFKELSYHINSRGDRMLYG